MQPAELIERCEELEAVTRMADELPSAVTEEDAEYLLRFRNPLEVVSDENGTPLKADEAFYVRYKAAMGDERIGPFRAFADAAAMHEALRQAHPEAEVVLGQEQ